MGRRGVRGRPSAGRSHKCRLAIPWWSVPDSQPADAAVPDVGVDMGLPADAGADRGATSPDATLNQGDGAHDAMADNATAADAGVGQDAALPIDPDGESGCACHVQGGDDRRPLWLWALVLIGVLCARGRRAGPCLSTRRRLGHR